MIEVAKATQVLREKIEQLDQGVLDCERHVERAVRGIKSSERLLQMRTRGQELAKMEVSHPAEPVARRGNSRICAVLAPLEQVGGDLLRRRQLPSDKVIHVLAVQHWHDFWRLVELLAQGASSGVGLPHCRGAIAVRDGQRPAKDDLQFEFLPLTRSRVRQK